MTESGSCFQEKRKLHRWLRTGRNIECTHTMMNGGKLVVPQQELRVLYQALSDDLTTNPDFRVFLTELRSKVSPMYFDLDLKKEEEAKWPAIWRAAILVMRDTMRAMFTKVALAAQPHLLDAVVCAVDGTDLSGVHVYFKNVLVDEERALSMRYAIVSELHHTHKHLADWDKVIDDAVYRKGTGGLRMPGSKKLAPCQECRGFNGMRNPNCPNMCDERGRACVGRQYRFFGLISDVDDEMTDSYRRSLASSWASLLSSTSLRRADGTALSNGYDPPKGMARPTEMPRLLSKFVLKAEHHAYQAVEACVRAYHPNYAHLYVDKIYQTTSGNNAKVFVRGRNATFCLNLLGDGKSMGNWHSSRRVWFQVTPRDLEPRCSCKCDTTDRRVSGKRCSEWRGGKAVLSEEARDALFPNKKYKDAGHYKRSADDMLTGGVVGSLKAVPQGFDDLLSVDPARAARAIRHNDYDNMLDSLGRMIGRTS